MCIKGKQRINFFLWGLAFLVLMTLGDILLSRANAQEAEPHRVGSSEMGPHAEIGGVVLGENLGGVLDRIYVAAPPNWQFTVSVAPGSFLDCGSGMAVAQTDEDGRDVFPMTCGVTLPETLVIPSASKPARVIIHF
ncbi:hypothetical protein [Parvularcula sp. IMCC14364]|uniref:hypothetical protein n=1 Tax=Parvularcula sp. IMCC14364 TaxID=3067902 RepID=UPI002740E887|nr:hypothetical protein [Parvularcula sp. IMCC14364]